MSPPAEERRTDGSGRGERNGPEAWGREDDDGEDDSSSLGLLAQDFATSIAAVLLLGVYLFAVSGVWPPMVAIESGSMEPNMQVNDLAFVMDTDRFQPNASGAVGPGDTGVVTAAVGEETGYSQFSNSGDVIVFEPDGNGRRTPIIHRAMFWVEAGENWCEHEAADQVFLAETNQCEAPHAGFITKGDNNPTYDQAGSQQITAPVRPGWIVGTAEMRIPWLGWFRLQT